MSEETSFTVKIIDSLMGTWKTTAIINHINKYPNDKYIYVTPYLKEVERICEKCPHADFIEPEDIDYDTKGRHLKTLVEHGRNICMSHELLRRADSSLCSQIKKYQYTLILDEEVQVVEEIEISKRDYQILIEQNLISHHEDGAIHWIDDSYTGYFNEVRRKTREKGLTHYIDGCFLWMFNIDLFKSFKEIYVLTYLYEGSILWAYMKLHAIDFEYYHIENKQIVAGYQPITDKFDKALIEIYHGRLNSIGSISGGLKKKSDKKESGLLSSTWYKHSTKKQHKVLRNNLYNYYRHNCPETIPAKAKMWSTFSPYEKKICADGCANAFLACNARATNDFIERYALAYLINMFPRPITYNYFKNHGFIINQDKYALSQMIQWIWRSRIRKGEPIYLYLPSARMRRILESWLDEISMPPETAWQLKEKIE